ncbi:MAG: porin family protein [Staphylococcus sp.]|nr:porin family protein [Staphylococcus sp.]
MKLLKALLLSLIMIAGAAVPAQAQFKFGPKVGLTVNDLHFNKSVVDADNQTGWTAGLMTEFTVPVIGLGFDLSAMYVRRNAQFLQEQNLTKDNRDYIEIPLNLKYKFSLPVVSKILVPYLGVGPSVSFLTSRKSVENAYRNKSVDWALNFGFGVQLFSHLDVNARYGLGLTKAINSFSDNGNAGIEGKNRYWTISLAYLF